jgi:hypothetical protein
VVGRNPNIHESGTHGAGGPKVRVRENSFKKGRDGLVTLFSNPGVFVEGDYERIEDMKLTSNLQR